MPPGGETTERPGDGAKQIRRTPKGGEDSRPLLACERGRKRERVGQNQAGGLGVVREFGGPGVDVFRAL